MTDELKVAEAPVITPEAAADESLIDKRRAAIESAVITANETFPEPEVEPSDAPASKEPELKKEDPKAPELDPIQKIKDSVQKRIDKVVAQKKSAEEELAEARAEIERLKANPKSPDPVSKSKDDTPPTPEQVEAYIAKMSEEGNHKEVAAATRYLIKLEKEIAFKEIEEKQNQTQKQTETEKARIDFEMKALAMDYVVYDDKGNPDAKSDLTLSNQQGLLFKTALSLYNDKELHAQHYNDPNVVNGFRRAVADAYREIHQQGLIKPTPKGETTLRTPRVSLADPSAEIPEETTQVGSNSLSDAEKVREEIRNRNKNRFQR